METISAKIKAKGKEYKIFVGSSILSKIADFIIWKNGQEVD